jgi:GNAT superfamily N-acetyltransferase
MTLPQPDQRLTHAEGIITLSDANTTLGYCRYADDGEVEYLFVAAPYRRRGIARWLLDQVAGRLGPALRFREPLSPLGRQLVASWIRSRPS